MLPLNHEAGHDASVSREAPWRLPRTWVVPSLLALGVLVLYLPTYWQLLRTVWATDEQGHGPLIVALCGWLAVQRWPQLMALPERRAMGLGGGLLALSLLAYVLGHSQGIPAIEMVSQIGVLSALLLCFKGPAGLRVMALPLAFLLFAVPLPGILVQTLTMPLKIAVSACAEWLLHLMGYSVGRTGVMLVIGQYQLLVADACAGLNSMFTLEALGFLWMSLRPRSTPWRDTLLAIVILPISFAANVIRVMALVLITYHFGDAAGQGFAHSFSGVLLFVAAVLLMMVAEAVIRRPGRARASSDGVATTARSTARPTVHSALRQRADDRGSRPKTRAVVLLLAMLLAAALAEAMRPRQDLTSQMQAVHLSEQVPRAFAGWRLDESTIPVLPDPTLQARMDTVYNQTLARAYVNARGERVMLTIAYGRDQSSEATAVHRPEFCYGAQGFQVSGRGVQRVSLDDGSVAVQRLVGTLGKRVEPISYWVTLADQATLPGMGRKLAQLRLGLAGYVADGMLVRVSTIGMPPAGSPASPYAAQDRFLQDLARALPSDVRVRYFGV